MDLDPFEPVGINADTMRVLDVFLLHCLLSDSPPDSPQEMACLATNQHRTAARGREPGVRLEDTHGGAPLLPHALEILDECRPLAEALAHALDDARYVHSLDLVLGRLKQPDQLPSARMLQAMREGFGGSFTHFVQARSEDARQRIVELPFDDALRGRFEALALESVQAQVRIEASDTMPFEVYRQSYLAEERLGRLA